MPTVGWIREGDLDAFYEGTERTPDRLPPSAPNFPCPFCAWISARQHDFHEHVYAMHRVERPLLMLRSGEPAAHDVVRSSLLAADIATVNASFAKVCIDGASPRRCTPNDLKELLAGMEQAEIKLELVNATATNSTPVTTIYNISFRVADLRSLKGVEAAFTEALVSNTITRDAIGRFLSDERVQSAGKEYASALADYCLGILLKERPDGEMLTTPLSRYRELYGSALDVLKDLQRPLARLIASVIRFSMNDFRSDERTGYWELDLAMELLLNPASEALPKSLRDAPRCPVCPVDHGTGRVLELASQLVAQPRWSPILDDECRALAESELLDVNDHQKAFAIWAAAAWRLGFKQNALEPLGQVAEIYPFSRWASTYLEQAST